MKPGIKIVKDITVHVDHDIVVKNLQHQSAAECFTCYGSDENRTNFIFATGSRHHVNRQVRIHRSR